MPVIVSLLFIPLFSLKFPVLQENLDVYMGLQQFIVTTGTSEKLSFLFSKFLSLYPLSFLLRYNHTEWYKLNTEKYVWLFIMFFFQVGGLISLRRMIAVDFTVLSGTSAPYFKLSDAWLSISSEKSLLHVSLMPWQWWRGQFSKCTFQFIKKCFLGLHHYNILFDMLQQNCHSTVNSFHS